MTLGRAFILSLVLHASVWLLVLWSRAQVDGDGLAQPPVSSLQARIFTYEKAQAPAGASPQPLNLAASQATSGEQALPKDPDTPKPSKVLAPAVPVTSPPESIPDSASLDVSPVVISSVTLEYPPTANNREGLVTLAIVVAADGNVEDVSVVKATPSGFFEAAAIAGFKNARFRPGLLGGLGVKSRMLVEVEFMPTNRGGAVSGQR